MRFAAVAGCCSIAVFSFAQTPATSQAFVENKGQWDSQAKFLSRQKGLNLWITDEGPVLDFYKFTRTNKVDPSPKLDRAEGIRKGQVVRMSFVGATQPVSSGTLPQKGVFNYIHGKDSSSVIKGAHLFGETHIQGIYNGISARYYFDKGSPRYDLIVSKGADPSQIAMRMEGTNGVSVLANGNLRIETSLGPIEESGLTVYQLDGAKKKIIPAQMAVDGETVHFQVGSYDKTKDLVIDPVLFSSYIGGSGGGTVGDKVLAVTGTGYTHLSHDQFAVGTAESPDFPTTSGAYQTTKQQGGQGFVADMFLDGTLIWCTFIQGTSQNSSALLEVTCATVDTPTDQVLIAGYVENEIYPTTVGAFQTSNKNTAVFQSFVSELSQDGTTLQYSTYLSGTTSDTTILGIARLSSNGDIAVTGRTKATDFPMWYPVQDTNNSANGGLSGCAFAAILSSDFKTQEFGTYIGGYGSEIGYAVAISSPPELVTVAGNTTSGDLPVTDSCYQASNNASSGTTGFVIQVGPGGGSGFTSGCSYFGGSVADQINALFLNADGSIIIGGSTSSPNIATGGYQAGLQGLQNGFIANLSGGATSLNAFTYLGGYGTDSIYGISDDGAGGLYAVGEAGSFDFPTTLGSYQTFQGTTYSGFLARLPQTLGSIAYCTFYGNNTSVNAVCVDGSGNAFIGGSAGYVPTTPGAFQSQNANGGSGTNGFIADISPSTEYVNIYGPGGYTIVGGSTVTGNVVMSSVANQAGSTVGIYTFSPLVTVPSSIMVPPNSVIGSFNIVCQNVSSATPASIDAVYGNDTAYRFKIMPHGVKSVTFSPTSIVGGKTITGTVTLSGPAGATPMTVGLASSATTKLEVPATMTIAPGATSGTFTATSFPVDASTPVTITATNDSNSVGGTGTVIPPTAAKVTFSASPVIGGTNSTGTLILIAKAGPAGVTVPLTSSDTAAAQVPASVKILGGATSATFTITTHQVAATSTSTISAKFGLTASSVLTILPDQLTSLTIAPTSVVGGGDTFATVHLAVPVAADAVTVNLASSNTAVAKVASAQISISKAGASSQSVTIYTSPVNAATSVNITAICNGVTKTQVFTVAVPVLLSVATTPATVKGGTSVSCTVAINGFSGSLGTVVTLKSSSAKVVLPASVKVVAGKSTVTFTVATSTVTAATPVTFTATLGTVVKTFILTLTS
jgi:hypothetical protein